MVRGEEGVYHLARATIVHIPTAVVLIDVLVKPREPIEDYVTRFSGITKEMLEPRTRRIVVKKRRGEGGDGKASAAPEFKLVSVGGVTTAVEVSAAKITNRGVTNALNGRKEEDDNDDNPHPTLDFSDLAGAGSSASAKKKNELDVGQEGHNDDADDHDDELSMMLSDITSEDSLCEYNIVVEEEEEEAEEGNHNHDEEDNDNDDAAGIENGNKDYDKSSGSSGTTKLPPLWRIEDVQDLFQLLLDDCHARKIERRRLAHHLHNHHHYNNSVGNTGANAHDNTLYSNASNAENNEEVDDEEKKNSTAASLLSSALSSDEHVFMIGHSLENDFKACRIPLRRRATDALLQTICRSYNYYNESFFTF